MHLGGEPHPGSRTQATAATAAANDDAVTDSQPWKFFTTSRAGKALERAEIGQGKPHAGTQPSPTLKAGEAGEPATDWAASGTLQPRPSAALGSCDSSSDGQQGLFSSSLKRASSSPCCFAPASGCTAPPPPALVQLNLLGGLEAQAVGKGGPRSLHQQLAEQHHQHKLAYTHGLLSDTATLRPAQEAAVAAAAVTAPAGAGELPSSSDKELILKLAAMLAAAEELRATAEFERAVMQERLEGQARRLAQLQGQVQRQHGVIATLAASRGEAFEERWGLKLELQQANAAADAAQRSTAHLQQALEQQRSAAEQACAAASEEGERAAEERWHGRVLELRTQLADARCKLQHSQEAKAAALHQLACKTGALRVRGHPESSAKVAELAALRSRRPPATTLIRSWLRAASIASADAEGCSSAGGGGSGRDWSSSPSCCEQVGPPSPLRDDDAAASSDGGSSPLSTDGGSSPAGTLGGSEGSQEGSEGGGHGRPPSPAYKINKAASELWY